MNGQIADVLTLKMEALGFDVEEDDSDDRTGPWCR